MCFIDAIDFFGNKFDITVFSKDYERIKNDIEKKIMCICKLKNNLYKEKISFVFADKKLKNILK